MLLRQLFKDAGRSATSGSMQRMVKNSQNQWVPFSVWQAEQQRLAAAVERQRRMPNSEGETYDTSQRRPSSEKATYDFSF